MRRVAPDKTGLAEIGAKKPRHRNDIAASSCAVQDRSDHKTKAPANHPNLVCWLVGCRFLFLLERVFIPSQATMVGQFAAVFVGGFFVFAPDTGLAAPTF